MDDFPITKKMIDDQYLESQGTELRVSGLLDELSDCASKYKVMISVTITPYNE
jgi:hypothetical protein